MKETQCSIILEHLKEHGSITGMIAVQEYGIMRLASRIKDLRERGVPIVSETVTAKNRNGGTVHYSVYRLKEADKA